MATDPSQGILALPLELHLRIIRELHAPDVLSLGQRHVWEAALRATCRLNQLFEPSYYPLEDMDLPELQRAALEPWRRSASFALESRSNTASGDEDADASRNLLQKKIHLELDNEPSFEDVYIVPGGRYVLGMTQSLRTICLWDMGQTGKVPWDTMHDRLQPISIMRTTHGGIIWDMSAPKAVDITSFRFATIEITPMDICVYEVGPLPNVCSIREIANLRVNIQDLPGDLWLQGNNLVCVFSKGLIVWDFVESRYIAIQSRGSDVAKITTNGNLIIAWVGPDIGVWTIPPLKPLESPSSLDLSALHSEELADSIDFNTIRPDERSVWPTTSSSRLLGIPSHQTRWSTLFFIGVRRRSQWSALSLTLS
ncbi:hypothetical protein DFP72DRAFT_1059478 [Ephemerocybe angulata]|uniref:Uncharacterized protein n=1 Tax=Ephemerocybe angulata TaxID=980116 RepID=A0A8H6IFH9_9AGAR|nr:hypothetical protein DFP72DRAFT_1059478 [Tulosesus angulatus]